MKQGIVYSWLDDANPKAHVGRSERKAVQLTTRSSIKGVHNGTGTVAGNSTRYNQRETEMIHTVGALGRKPGELRGGLGPVKCGG